MVIRVSHLTDQVEIAGGGHAPIVSAARGPAPPPSAGPRAPNPNTNPTPSLASDSCTSIPLGGYDDPFLFQHPWKVADFEIFKQDNVQATALQLRWVRLEVSPAALNKI